MPMSDEHELLETKAETRQGALNILLRRMQTAFGALQIHCCGEWGHHAVTLANAGDLDQDGRILENPVHYRDARTAGVMDEVFQTIPRKEVPADMDLEQGDFIGIQTPDGRQIPAQIKQLDDDKMLLDLNHPLAGMALTFEIEVVGISDTPTQENDCCSSGCECSSGCH